MGTIADVVHFNMMQPLQGQTTKSPNPLQPLAIDNSTQQTPDPLQEGLTSGAKSLATGIENRPKDSTAQTLPALPSPEDSNGVVGSDENIKTNINPADKEITGFLSHLGAHQYEYKNEKHGIGTHFGIMAQELEKSPVGKQAVINTKDGKMVNTSRLVLPLLSAAAMHNENIETNTNDIKEIRKEVKALSNYIKNRKK